MSRQQHDSIGPEVIPPALDTDRSPSRAPALEAGLGPPIGRALLLKKLARRRAERGDGETLQRKAGNREELPAASEDQIAQQGFSGTPGALPYRSEMEAGFGRSFSHVQVHHGPEAQAASEALGAEAYAVGQQIALKSASPAKEVVAHELAHTIQQQGGSAVQTFAASHPDHLEAEADAAAATVVGGGRAEIQLTTGGGGIHKWAGSDHYAIGNLGGQKALTRFTDLFPNAHNGPATRNQDVVHGGPGASMTTTPGQTLSIGTGPGTSISMGEASRFSGDYASTPDALHGRNQEGGTKANWNPLDWRATHEESAMVMTAATNSNHFYPLNRMEWAGHHSQALTLAASGNMTAAMQQEGYACHFLQDTFSSGHMAPRALDSIPHMTGGTDWLGSDARDGLSRSKQWHDFFCMTPNGLPTNRGRFHGDNYMDGNDLEVASNAVRDSLLEVLSAGQGQPVSLNVAAQAPVPNLSEILADPVAGPVWRLMQDSYRADFQAAQRQVRPGQTGTTEGGTTYDSRQVLDQIAHNVMGAGPDQPAAGNYAEQVGQKQSDLVGSLTSIHHYVTATWDAQIYLHQDDDMAPSNPSSPHYKLQELESKFHLFSAAGTQVAALLTALQGYSGLAQGPGQAQANREIAAVQALQQQITGWSRLVADAGSLFTIRASTIQGYRNQIVTESAAGLQALRGYPRLPTEENACSAQPGQAARAG